MTKGNAGSKLLGLAVTLLMCLSGFAMLAPGASATPVEYLAGLDNLPQTRLYAPTVEDDGMLYTIGGILSSASGGTSLTSLLIYDIVTGETTRGADLPVGVAYMSAAVGTDGRVYVFGGFNLSLGYTAQVQIYNITSDSWTTGTPASLGMGAGAAVTVSNGTIYVFGAATDEASTLAYDPVTDTWTDMADRPNAAWVSRAVLWDSTSIIVMGGRVSGSTTNAVDIYNPVTDTWSSAEPMPGARMWGGAFVGTDGYVYYVGGSTASWPTTAGATDTLFRYAPDVDEWETSTSTLWDARDAFGMTTDSYGRTFLVGGYDDSSAQSSVWMIVTADVTWDDLEIASPSDGSVVSGEVAVAVSVMNANYGTARVDLLVDGVLLQSSGQIWSGTITFMWDTTGLADGSSHVLTAIGILWNGEVREDVVTVTVSGMSVEEQVADIVQQLAVLQAMLSVPGANLTSLAIEAAILQAKLDGIIAGLGAMGASSSVMWDQLNVTFAALQTQLDDFQAQIDRVEDKADTAGTYGIVTMVLVIIIIILAALMLMMARKKP